MNFVEDLADFVQRFDPLQPARDEVDSAGELADVCIFCSIHRGRNTVKLSKSLKNVRGLPPISNGRGLEFLVCAVLAGSRRNFERSDNRHPRCFFCLSHLSRIQIDVHAAHAAFQLFRPSRLFSVASPYGSRAGISIVELSWAPFLDGAFFSLRT